MNINLLKTQTIEDNLRTAYHLIKDIVDENKDIDNENIIDLENARLLIKGVLIKCENGKFC